MGTLGLPGIVFEHQPEQAPLTRSLEAGVVALLDLKTRMSEVERITGERTRERIWTPPRLKPQIVS